MILEPVLPPIDHDVPTDGLTVQAAHIVMQSHIDCPITICRIKLHAKTVLVRHGHLNPAEQPKFGF
ncbi:hypothetical protein ACQP0C_08075 [Nocardia sp. CA-129566]|uniref:hypothetical protein n=1 Tax=Nocardia sp. CA-129566 TaxID=3239976 RepID=UPI003D96B13E